MKICTECRFYKENRRKGTFSQHFCTYGRTVNPITGEITYDMCSRYNMDGQCPQFAARPSFLDRLLEKFLGL